MTQLENLLKCQVVGEHPRNGNWELTVGRGFSELAVAGQPCPPELLALLPAAPFFPLEALFWPWRCHYLLVFLPPCWPLLSLIPSPSDL